MVCAPVRTRSKELDFYFTNKHFLVTNTLKNNLSRKYFHIQINFMVSIHVARSNYTIILHVLTQ